MSRSKRNAAADEYFKRVPGYSSELLRDLDLYLRRPPYGRERGITQAYFDLLPASHKFALAGDGFLFDKTTEEMIVGTRLPYPACVFEYSVRGQATVAIAIEHNGAISVGCCFRLDESPLAVKWGVLPVCAHYEIGADITKSRLWTTDFFSDAIGDYDKECFTNVALRAGQVVFQNCAAMSCSNVTTEVIRPNREARAARPASTLFDYHVLMIDPSKERNPSEDRGGTHASPRTHLRRGHIRRLAWGPRVWVNSCVVNPSAIGTVNKDYRVKG